MLARVANNLYWMGRYIERAEHVARYLRVNYFSSLDAPDDLSQSRQFVLQSMLYMVGNPIESPKNKLDEEKILFDIGLNPAVNYSIIHSISMARENANSARDLISTELYEAINKFYHFALNYPPEVFVKKGLYDYTVNTTEMTAALRARIRGTLLHNEVLAIIMLGIYMERANQIVRIINAKYNDARIICDNTGNSIDTCFEWITLLKCAESYDMMRRFYKKIPQSLTTIQFLLLNSDCPRSVMFSLDKIYQNIQVMDSRKYPDNLSAAFLIGKVRSEYKFKVVDEIEEDIPGAIERLNDQLNLIAEKMELEFFNY